MLATVPNTPIILKTEIEVICLTSLGKISREGYTYASIPRSRDVRQPSFNLHRILLSWWLGS